MPKKQDKHYYHTSEGNFILPNQWKELLGEEVLSKHKTVASRLSELHIDRHYFSRIMRQVPEYAEFYNVLEQKRLCVKLGKDKRALSAKEYWQKNYGANSPLAVKEIKDKADATLIERFGTKFPLRLKEIRQKVINTDLSRYGTNSPLSVKEFSDKAKQTIFKRYGVPVFGQIPIDKLREDCFKYYRIILPDTVKSAAIGIDFTAICADCGRFFVSHFNSNQIPVVCPFCNERSTVLERSIAAYLAEHTDIIPHYRPNFLHNKEIDIYLPGYRIGFEINGAFSHNSDWTPYNATVKSHYYHRDKSQVCLENNVRLIHLWEHWDRNKIFSFINTKLGLNKKIFARKCDFIQISSKEAKPFLDANHIHSFTKANYFFSLKLDNKIVGVISFVKHTDSIYYLSRLCFASGYSVVGGSEKLFKHSVEFLKSIGVSVIESYAYRDLTPFPEESVYVHLGFTFDGFTEPALFYYVNRSFDTPSGRRISAGIYSRLKFQTHKMIETYGYPDSFTASQLREIGIYRVFDSGNLKFIYNI